MSAEGVEMIAAGFQGAGEMEPGDRTPAPLAVAIGHGDHDGRAVQAIDNARGDDADYAGMPSFCPKHDAAAAVGVEAIRFHLLERSLEDHFLDGLAGTVLLFQIRGDLSGLRFRG